MCREPLFSLPGERKGVEGENVLFFNEGKTSLLQSRAENSLQEQLTGQCGKWATGCFLDALERRDDNAVEAKMHRVNYCLILDLCPGGTA